MVKMVDVRFGGQDKLFYISDEPNVKLLSLTLFFLAEALLRMITVTGSSGSRRGLGTNIRSRRLPFTRDRSMNGSEKRPQE